MATGFRAIGSAPGGHAFLSLFPLPNVGGPAKLQQLGDVGYDAHQLRPAAHPRGTGASVSSARVMVRYTHDRWKNDAPSFQSNLWGDDPFPSVDSNWDYEEVSCLSCR